MKLLNETEVKNYQLYILDEVDKYCKANGISYYLSYGTLIGAVRHKGYIPWDDDIDIVMRLEDYDRFISGFNSNKNNVFVNHINVDKNWTYPYAKIYHTDTLLDEKSDFPYKDIGVNIDLFPICSFPNDPKQQKSIINKAKVLYYIQTLKLVKINSKRSLYKNLILMIGKVLFAAIPFSYITKKIEGLVRKNYIGNYIVCPCGGLVGNSLDFVDEKVFSETIEVEFEGKIYPAPIGTDAWLRNVYGDYMKLPPIEKQVTHHAYKAYVK